MYLEDCRRGKFIFVGQITKSKTIFLVRERVGDYRRRLWKSGDMDQTKWRVKRLWRSCRIWS